jgi:hypothetical protein
MARLKWAAPAASAWFFRLHRQPLLAATGPNRCSIALRVGLALAIPLPACKIAGNGVSSASVTTISILRNNYSTIFAPIPPAATGGAGPSSLLRLRTPGPSLAAEHTRTLGRTAPSKKTRKKGLTTSMPVIYSLKRTNSASRQRVAEPSSVPKRRGAAHFRAKRRPLGMQAAGMNHRPEMRFPIKPAMGQLAAWLCACPHRPAELTHLP